MFEEDVVELTETNEVEFVPVAEEVYIWEKIAKPSFAKTA